MGTIVLATETQSPVEEEAAHHAGSHKLHWGEQSEKRGLWEAGFVVKRGRCDFCFLWEDVIRLFK